MSQETKKILIVEDDKNFLWILRQAFDGQGLEVVYAEDGDKGIEMAESEKPDLMLIDVKLSETQEKMSGIEMARQIKAKGLNPKMIFLTNMTDPGRVSEALEVTGESDYMIKVNMAIDSIVKRVKDKLGIK